MFNKLASAAFAAALALATLAPSAHAQKALVYCPVGVDAAGCDRVVAALQSKFADGVDRGYDGSAGTVDLNKADLNHYSVVVVPSLADNGDKQPYAVLRAAAARLRLAINGRVAVYSGAPDQGSANRTDKDALIQNLAMWAAKGHTRGTSLVGLVAFLDLSDNESDRYAWVKNVSLVDVSADAELQAFPEVSTVSPRGGKLLSNGGKALRFANMASYGLHIGRRAAARTEVGATGGASGAQSVLVTYANADGSDLDDSGSSTGKVGASGGSFNMSPGTSASLSSSASTTGATLTTDKSDYQPGDTVTFTGAGFAPGDTVTITLHEDPTWSYPDRQFKSVADGSGAFINRQMVVVQQDFGATFTATAVGNPSGIVAQTTFTDGNATSVSGTVTDASNNLPLAGVTVSCTTTTGCNANFSTTTDASGNYVFSGGNKLTFDTNGPVTLVLTFSKTGFATGSLTLSNVNNGNTRTAQDIALTPAGPTKLAFTNAVLTGVVNQCIGPITIQSQNASNAATNVTSLTTVNLTTDNGSTGAGAFYTSNTCTTSTPTTTIAAGSSSATQVFYKATSRGTGNHGLTAAASGLTSASQTETINKASQTGLTTNATSPQIYNTTQTLTTSGGSGTGTVTFSKVSGPCTLVGDQLTANSGTGSCVVNATKATDNDYLATTSADVTVTLAKAAQATLTTNAVSPQTFNTTQTLTATGGTGTGALSFTKVSGPCTLLGDQLTANSGTGSCVVNATKATDDNYLATTSADVTVTLQKAAQATLTTNAASPQIYNTTQTLTTSGGTGTGAVTFAFVSGPCTLVVAQLTANSGTGSCVVNATKATDDNYLPTTSANVTVTLQKAAQATLTTNATSPQTFNTTQTLTTSGGTGTGAVTFAFVSGPCTLAGDQLTANSGTGSCVVNATKAMDDNYLPTTSANVTVTLTKAAQATLTTSAASPQIFNTTQTLTTSGGTGTGAVTFNKVSGPCTLAGDQLTANSGTGSCVVNATKAMDDNYLPTTSANVTVTLTKAAQATLTTNAASPQIYNTTQTLTTSGGTGTGAVTFNKVSGPCTLAGDQLTANSGTGSCVVNATKATDDNYLPTTSADVTVTLQKAAQATLTTNAASPQIYNTTQTLTTSGGTGTGAVTFAKVSGPCTVAGDQLTANSGTGSCVVNATKATDDNYLPTTSANVTVTLQKAAQAPLTTNAASPQTFNTTQTLTTSGGSGTGAVTFAFVSGPCTLVVAQLTANSGTGSCVVNATKATDDNYLPTTSADVTVTLQKAAQAPLTTNAASPQTFNTTQTLTTSGGSGTGAVTFAFVSGPCTLVVAQLTANSGTGSCVVNATKATDNDYLATTSANVTVTLQKAAQAPLTTSAASPQTFNTTQTLTASGGSGTGAVTFNKVSGPCTLAGDQLTANSGTGSCVVNATKATDNNYLATTSADVTVTLQKAAQAPLTTNAASPQTFNTTQTLTTSGGTGTGAVTFAKVSGPCTVAGAQLTANSGTGSCVVNATKATDNDYLATTSADVTVTLQKAAQATLTTSAASPQTFNTTQTLTTSGGSGTGAVTFAFVSGPCTLAGDQLTANSGTGSCVVNATKATDNDYLATTSANVTVTLQKANQTITWATPAPITFGTNLAGVLNATVTIGEGTLSYNEGGTPLTTTTVLNAGTHTLTAVAGATNNYNSTSKMVSLTVNPAAATITLNNLVQPLNNIQSPTASATPVGSNTPLSVTFIFTYTVNGSPTLTRPTQVGVYPLDVDIAPGANYTGHADGYFVVYDPAGGFVTGGGWIDSPAGAYVADPKLAGKANFGFNSKYQKGATVPTGNTEFQFQEGNLNFKSTNFQWLVIQGSTKAQFKGTGTINGTGSYNFIVTVIDGDAFNGTKKPDAFRIKITDLNDNTVYDNQIGKDETGDFATTLGGGSIVIHDK